LKTTAIANLAEGKIIAIDGKYLRRSVDKSNEITTIPKLLERLNITDEDKNRARQGYSASNLAVIRHIALNLIKKKPLQK
jgi:predicted transposase YbfD/YdcC